MYFTPGATRRKKIFRVFLREKRSAPKVPKPKFGVKFENPKRFKEGGGSWVGGCPGLSGWVFFGYPLPPPLLKHSSGINT